MANKYKVTFMEPKTMIVEAKDLLNAGLAARNWSCAQPDMHGFPRTILRVDIAEEADLPVELEQQTS